MKSKINEIKSRRCKYENDYSLALAPRLTNLQNRLRKLVEKHGAEFVSEASGLTINTVKQYCRLKVPPMISEESVVKAEAVLRDI